MEIPDNCLLKFEASWCMPCKMLKPVLDKVSETTGVEVVSLDIDNHSELATQFNIRGVPTVIAIKNGAPFRVIVGAKKEADYVEVAEIVKR